MTPNIQHEKLPPGSDDGTDHDNNSDTLAPTCTNNLHTETSTFSDGKTPRYTATVKSEYCVSVVAPTRYRYPTPYPDAQLTLLNA